VTTNFLTFIRNNDSPLPFSPEPGGLNVLMHAGGAANPRGIILKLTGLAHRQIAGFCTIPWDYYGRMLKDAPQLLAVSVNHWLQVGQPARRLLCIEGDVLAAFLNPRFIGFAGERAERWDVDCATREPASQ
jgi:hypothetical protein